MIGGRTAGDSAWVAGRVAATGRGSPASKPVILVIDEFPYLVAKEPSIEAVLQMVWDRSLQETPVLVILIGSDEATMEALTEQGRPLYDRAREIDGGAVAGGDLAVARV